MQIVDRRLNPSSKSLENRQRFLRRAKALVQGAVKKSSQDRDILDVPVLGRFLYGPLNQGLGPAQKPLTVFEALAAWVQPSIYDLHDQICIHLSRLVSPACTTRPAGEP